MSADSFRRAVSMVVREDKTFLIKELTALIDERRKNAVAVNWGEPTNPYRSLKDYDSSTSVATEIVARALHETDYS